MPPSLPLVASKVNVYRALLPFCSDYTVADAHYAFLSVHPATKGLNYRSTVDDTGTR
jgi:hypothetical protein